MEEEIDTGVDKVTFSAIIKVSKKLKEFDENKRSALRGYFIECVVPLPYISSSTPSRVRVPLQFRNDFIAIELGVSMFSEQVKIRMDSKVVKARGMRDDSTFGCDLQKIDFEWEGNLNHSFYTSEEGAMNLLKVRSALLARRK